MKHRALDLLCCPACGGTLTCGTPFEVELDEGVLKCEGCDRLFPVINSVPRLLPDPLLRTLASYHPEFFRAHPDVRRPAEGEPDRADEAWWRSERKTVASYSYQWRKFKQMYPEWEEVFRESIRPIQPDFFPGKLGLDAGCGFGRSLRYSAQYGAEMIGLDLSEAIEAAVENTREFPNVHVVQGDIFNPPVRAASLDFVYSIGVLHHLPDPRAGFLSLTRLLKPGAPMFIWVYKRGRGRQIAVFTLVRAISTRLPLRLLSLASLLLAIGQWALWIAPFRLLKRFRATRGVADKLPFTYYARYPFRVLHTDWVDGLSVPLVNYYRPDEIAEWYRAAGHQRISIDHEWNGRALGFAPPP